MKRKWKNINKCESCGKRCVDYIWTTSRHVNNGIRVMYPDSKICRQCYKKMLTTYPEVNRPNYAPNECPLCKSRSIKKEKICKLAADEEDNYEYVCEDCGCVLQEDEL